VEEKILTASSPAQLTGTDRMERDGGSLLRSLAVAAPER
jgi:hypothetical protein